MTRADKSSAIESLKQDFENNKFFYIADSSSMSVADINRLRRMCFEKGVQVKVAKNTLVKKALESFPEDAGYAPLYEALKGPSTIMYSETASVPAKVIKEFRGKEERPILKAAYIDTDVFFGDDQLDALKSLKSKEDLIGDIILLLQSPIKNVVGSLQSGGNTISGLLKALEERPQS